MSLLPSHEIIIPKYLCKMRYFWFGIWVGENGRPNFTCYCYNNHMNNLSLLCKTKDNFEVYYDPISSHAATHFNDAPNLKELVIELLEGLETGGKEIARHFDMGKTDRNNGRR